MVDLQSILTVFEMAAQVVRAYPEQVNSDGKPIRCLRPNTFAVMNSMSDIDANNLLKTSKYFDKKYFFSRKWEDSHFQGASVVFDYPLIGCAIDTTQFAVKGRSKQCYRLNFFVLDQKAGYCSDCGEGDYCNVRTIEQTYEDLNTILRNFIQQLTDFVYAQLYKDGQQLSAGWYNKKYLDSLIETEIDLYEPLGDFYNYIRTKQTQGDFFPNAHNDDVAGLFTNIEICLDECIDSNQLDFDYSRTITDPIYGSGCISC